MFVKVLRKGRCLDKYVRKMFARLVKGAFLLNEY